MRVSGKIITVGLCPCWDTVCRLDGADWGEHKVMSASSTRPAGKALNISRALAWMGQTNTAAGLWGSEDYTQMLKAMQALEEAIEVKMTVVKGSTRRNITVVDTAKSRDMHLRGKSGLATKKALVKLKDDLEAIVGKDSICVFAGAMPQKRLLDDVIRIIKSCSSRGAEIVLDTSGDALRKILDACEILLIKPNVEELCKLLGKRVKDNPKNLVKAGRKLLNKVEMVVISRGEKGAIVVTNKGAWQCRCVDSGRVLSTVGCGDYLLGGFLKGLKDTSDVDKALETAIKVATARAWGWTEEMTWLEARQEIKVKTARI